MIAEKALALAGRDARLVTRPRGVLHIYTGPITDGGHVPRSRRTLCRVQTRQLTVERAVSSLVAVDRHPRRLCARCSAALLRDGNAAGQHPPTRLEYLRAHHDTTPAELVTALRLATTPDQVDAIAHLTLALFGVAGAGALVTGARSLTHEVIAARTRVHGWPASVHADAERFDLHIENATAARKARARQAREEKTNAWENTRPQMPSRTDSPQGATA